MQTRLTPDEALAVIDLTDQLRASEMITRAELLSAIAEAGDWPGVDWPSVGERVAALDDTVTWSLLEILQLNRHSPDLLERLDALTQFEVVSLEQEPVAPSLRTVATWSDTPLSDDLQLRPGRLLQFLRTFGYPFRQPEPRH